MDWARQVNRFKRLEKITKAEIVEFAKQHYAQNYVAVYKKHGQRKSEAKIQKPPITPIKVNRDRSSVFAKNLLAKKSSKVQPVFVDFKKDIGYYDITPEISLNYVPNRENELYSLCSTRDRT